MPAGGTMWTSVSVPGGSSPPLSDAAAMTGIIGRRPDAGAWDAGARNDRCAPDDGGGDEADAMSGDGPDAMSGDDAGDPYLLMCRHYCDALEETGVYFCLASGRDAATCAPAGSAELCFDDRCATRLLPPPLCLTQCDALDSHYRAACGDGGTVAGDARSCPSTPEAHDAACRAGC